MPSTPIVTERRIERMLSAWRTLAPNKTFAGMTLAQFEAAAAPSLTARQRLVELDNETKQQTANRDHADDSFNVKAKQVVAGVLADPTEGPDSALYEAFGYTRESERKSGLKRGKHTEPAAK